MCTRPVPPNSRCPVKPRPLSPASGSTRHSANGWCCMLFLRADSPEFFLSLQTTDPAACVPAGVWRPTRQSSLIALCPPVWVQPLLDEQDFLPRLDVHLEYAVIGQSLARLPAGQGATVVDQPLAIR
jgi:hypothetical protein